MPERDTGAELGHPEVAGWVLGALDPEETGSFWDHLGSCGECQAELAELQPVARMLASAAPAVQPPADLQARTLARVKQAARPPAARTSTWRRWNVRLLSLTAAATATAAAAVATAFVVLQAAPAVAATFSLHAPPGGSSPGGRASGQATVHHTADGWSIQLTVHGLKDLGTGRFYECWYASPGSRPGRSQLITAGTFTIGPSGSATVQMSSAADPHKFRIMQITAERAGDARQHGKIILTGTARS